MPLGKGELGHRWKRRIISSQLQEGKLCVKIQVQLPNSNGAKAESSAQTSAHTPRWEKVVIDHRFNPANNCCRPERKSQAGANIGLEFNPGSTGITGKTAG